MAQRIQLKRSSVQGRRPADQYLEPGELALNTNQNDPGLFFETNTGDIAKVGPAYIGPQPPTTEVGYGPGEQWLDTGNGTFNLYVPALDQWVPIQSPLFGGADTAIFVGSEFPEASDDLLNDGIARPFATLNRATIEVARRSILAGRNDDVFNGRFTIVLLPGQNVVCNDPGVDLGFFEQQVAGFAQDQSITQDLIRLFNTPEGGLVVPRGTSIIALDLRKTNIHPTYYPFWSRALFEEDSALIEPRSSILRWTGNSYFTSFTFKDKVSRVSVSGIDAADGNDPAILTSLRPHGFRTLVTTEASSDEIAAADRVILSYPPGVPQLYDGVPTVSAGDYYAEPLTTYTFRLRNTDTGEVILRNQLPEIGVPGSSPPDFLTLTYPLTTHHRLTCVDFATEGDLNVFYSKVQRAFSLQDFAGAVNNAEVAPGETTIVAQLPAVPDDTVDRVKNASPYIFNCSTRSDYGLCGGLVDGAKVNGFKSALFCNYTVVSLQNDPDVYEVYNATEKTWVSLKMAYAASKGIPVADVTSEDAIDYLLSTVKVGDTRFYYRTAFDSPDDKSSGLPDDVSDTRHYAVKATNSAFSQIVASFAIGVSVNYWAKDGGTISVANANSNFGGIALRAEGFAGIGTSGGAEDPDKGFTIQGIRRPAAITKQMVLDTNNTKRIFVNARISAITDTTITFDTELDTRAILPYTFRQGSYVWVEDYDTGTTYKAQLSTVGNPLSSDRLTLTTETAGNEIYAAVNGGVPLTRLSLMYIRRFVDPRPPIDRNYSLWVNNTSQSHRPPEIGFILRLAEKPGAGVANLLKIGSQLDPGQTGGWNHLFNVTDTRTQSEGDNPNGSEPLIVPTQGAQNYYVTLSSVDGFKPWLPQGNNGFNTTNVEFNYPRGAYASYEERLFYASFNDEAQEEFKPDPVENKSAWLRSKNYEYCQPVDQTWVGSDSVANTQDPTDSYPQLSCYPRGVQYDRTNPTFNNVYDNDDGTTTLGLISGGSSLADATIYDPWWHPTKAAMTRLLVLLGFSYEQVEAMLVPQLWTSRNLSVTAMENVGPNGYAHYTGTWPVEFNRPSTIRCGNHTWEWAGYYTYAKGLPRYQTSQLSLRERFDAMSMEVWGGVVYATGQDERGEFLITGKTVAGGTGTTLLRTEATAEYFAPQDVTA